MDGEKDKLVQNILKIFSLNKILASEFIFKLVCLAGDQRYVSRKKTC